MIIIFIRCLLLYTFVLVTLRIMGKGELSQLQPYEFVVVLMMAENAALPMEDTGIPLINGFVAVGTLLLTQLIVSNIILRSNKARALICGKPNIIINKGILDEKELRRLRISINDILEQLRIKDYPSILDVEYAILETNGDISIIPKENKRSVTLEDLNVDYEEKSLPIALIIDRKINYGNLKIVNLDVYWLKDQLKSKGFKDINEVLFAFLDENKNLYIQRKDYRG